MKVCAMLVVPTCWLANVYVAGVMLADGTIPVPDKATVPFVPTVRVPLSWPVAFGAKATLMVQEEPLRREVPQVLDGWVKSPAVVIAPTVSAAEPVLTSVTDCVALVLPTN